MTEHLFGLTVNEVMAYAAIANVVLVLVLIIITTFYAWHAKRQADASGEQVAASNRQTEIAQRTLDLLLRNNEQQRRIDIAVVSIQLAAAIHMIDRWQTRLASDSFPVLPDVIELQPTNFSSSVANADRIDGTVAGYMGAALLYIAEAETNIRVMRTLPQMWREPCKKAAEDLNVARFKFEQAKSRLSALTEGEKA
jgi:hypothetical protein